MSEQARVRHYFDENAARFDAIYGQNKSVISKFLNKVFRQVMIDRFQLVFRRCGDVKNKSILDVGCGSGRYSVDFAQRGAKEVIGIDFSSEMIHLAVHRAIQKNVSTRCTFIQGNFLQQKFMRTFDVVTAIGLFDYVHDPEVFLSQCHQLTDDVFFGSFPMRNDWRMPIRRLRLMLSNCPVYFYGEQQARQLCENAGFKHIKVWKLSRDYLVEEHP